MGANILVIGNGGRECALCWKLSQSPLVANVYASPGNGGTRTIPKTTNIEKSFPTHDSIGAWCVGNSISLVVIGPEKYLAEGLVDALSTRYGISCFGPNKMAAALESDKSYAKNFMTTYGIPTASYQTFDTSAAALTFVKENKNDPHVIKANGLAGGKGVIVAPSYQEAIDGIKEILVDKKYGSAGETIVIEEMLTGPEISCLAFVDGLTYALMPASQDHKRAYDGDKGPNTGGMGAYCPCPLATSEVMEDLRINVFDKLMTGLRTENIHYVGVIYAGVMLTTGGPKVLEFNCRFGDPETQVILPLLLDDLYHVMMRCCEGRLAECLPLKWDRDSYCAGVVLAGQGYPSIQCPKLPILEIPDTIYREWKVSGVDHQSVSQLIFEGGVEWVPQHPRGAGDTKSSEGDYKDHLVLCTTGAGRLFTVVGKAKSSLKLALALAYSLCTRFRIGPQADQYFYRTDIGSHGLAALKKGEDASKNANGNDPQVIDSYARAGVDTGRADTFLRNMTPAIASTYRTGVMGGIGGFSAIFDLQAIKSKYRDPLLVSGTDGVGSKLKVALEYGKGFQNVGIDLVAMSVNDVLASGAETLFFLDYFACGHLDIPTASMVMEGIVKGCKSAGCALVGGETAEIPDLYKNDDFDLAGFAVGVVDRQNVLPKKSSITEADVLIGIISSGFHSNGFSLLRKILRSSGLTFHDPCPWEDGGISIGDYLLTPTIIYNPYICPLFEGDNGIKAFAHITGGGLVENIPRVLPPELTASIDTLSWPVPPAFSWIRELGSLNTRDMGKVFNLGIGGVLVVSSEHQQKLLNYFDTVGIMAYPIGSIVKGSTVELLNLEESLDQSLTTANRLSLNDHNAYSHPHSTKLSMPPAHPISRDTHERKRVAVLISGTGTNLKALIEYTHNVGPAQRCNYEVSLVVSNKPDAPGLKIAKEYGIPTKVICHENFPRREDFDEEIHRELKSQNIHFVCLAGFMRLLSAPFVEKWANRLINTHPSLLPSFKGLHAPAQALAAGCKVAGFTIHYVVPDIDAGRIIAQEAVPIFPNDTEESLTDRIKCAEHSLYPKILNKVVNETHS